MKTLATALMTAAVCAAGPLTAQSAPVMVSTAWLADHMDDPNLVLLHVGMPHRMPETFIAGATFLDYHQFAAEQNGLSTEIMPVPQMVEALRAAGVSNDSRVILYSGGSAHVPARLYMTLDYLGHGAHTSVLDGGLETWTAEGRATSAEYATREPGTFRANINDNVLVSADWIAERLNDERVTLIDARPEYEYTGERSGDNLRPGHIPGAYNLFWTDLQISREQPLLRSLDEVQARWDEAGARRDGVVVSYCFIGMRASYTYMVSKHLGYDARFYDGSWNEWGARDDLPAVEGLKRR